MSLAVTFGETDTFRLESGLFIWLYTFLDLLSFTEKFLAIKSCDSNVEICFFKF